SARPAIPCRQSVEASAQLSRGGLPWGYGAGIFVGPRARAMFIFVSSSSLSSSSSPPPHSGPFAFALRASSTRPRPLVSCGIRADELLLRCYVSRCLSVPLDIVHTSLPCVRSRSRSPSFASFAFPCAYERACRMGGWIGGEPGSGVSSGDARWTEGARFWMLQRTTRRSASFGVRVVCVPMRLRTFFLAGWRRTTSHGDVRWMLYVYTTTQDGGWHARLRSLHRRNEAGPSLYVGRVW
ncbi:hypothetical protein AB1N83_012323, partial [Pleurotus pulmonarius]